MTTNRYFALMVAATSGLIVAQAQTPGPWRSANDRPPAPPQQAQSQDPTQPVDRSDAYGQPSPNGQQPPGYGQPAPNGQQPPVYSQPAPYGQQPPGYGQPSPDYPDPMQQPQGRPVPQKSPAYGLPSAVTLNAGTYITIRTNQVLSTDHNQQGDAFSGTLVQPVVVDGIVVAQRGQTVYGLVSQVQKNTASRESRLGLQLTSFTVADGAQVPLRTIMIGREGGTVPAGAQAGAIVGTTAVGAAIGAAAGWGRGAAIGAVAGAAAGIIGVVVTRNRPTVLFPETALTFRVESPVGINLARAPQAFRYVDPYEFDQPGGGPQLQRRAPGCSGYGCATPGPSTYYGYGPGYGPGPGYYPYPYPWGGVAVVWGPGYFYGRGYYRRWR